MLTPARFVILLDALCYYMLAAREGRVHTPYSDDTPTASTTTHVEPVFRLTSTENGDDLIERPPLWPSQQYRPFHPDVGNQSR